MKWIWFAVILRRPYARRPEDGRFDIWDALNGKRDVASYGNSESYAMLDIPSDHGREDGSGDNDEESGHPSSLLPGGKKHRGTPDLQMMEEPMTGDAKFEPSQEYSNTYGKEKV